jgi:type VI secretion system protein VasG
LPDKSVSLLDTACARVAIGQGSTPSAVEDRRRRVEQLGVAIDVLERENVTGGEHGKKLGELKEELTTVQAELKALEERWEKEKKLVSEIRQRRDQLEGRPAPVKKVADVAKPPEPVKPVELSPQDRERLRGELDKLNAELHELQGESPLMSVCVDSQAIADIVSAWTGIPVGRMVSNEIQTVLNLKEKMEERIIGQSHALDAIAQSIRTSRAGLTDPRRPIGVFMLVGPSGTGKTETAITLADLLYGGEQNMTVINMSEFKEEHKVSLLMGSPPGYVGYGEGGVLTEAVRRRPYSVVLLDELEKAHPGVQEIFYQVFDKGMLRDGEGRDIDFKNTVILMTSNAASDTVMKLCADPDTMPDAAGLSEALRPELLKVFKPAFLGRISVVPFFPLGDQVLRNIIELKLKQVRRRVEENYQAQFSYDSELVNTIASRCKEVESGARNIDHIISRTLLPALSAEFLSRMAEGGSIESVRLGVDASGGFVYDIK